VSRSHQVTGFCFLIHNGLDRFRTVTCRDSCCCTFSKKVYGNGKAVSLDR
jgi:hypothetical protein